MKSFFGWLNENAQDLIAQLQGLLDQLDHQDLNRGFNYRDFNRALEQAQSLAAGYERRGYIPPQSLGDIEQAMNNQPAALPRIIIATMSKIQQWQPTATPNAFRSFGDDDE